MQTKRRATDAPDQPAKKPRRWLWVAGLTLSLLCACGRAAALSQPATETAPAPATALPARETAPPPAPTVAATVPPATETAPAPLTLSDAAQLAWPAAGQAAIGSMDAGVLAHSSDHETLSATASMAKVITALAIMEKQPFELGQPGQTYTITDQDIASMQADIAENGSTQPLLIGMHITQYQALQRMLIASDNNMADILAERIFGSQAAYISYAQAMLQRMGLSQTVVADASGFSAATASTPSELVALGIAALKNPVIAAIVAQPQAELPVTGVLYNTNELLGVDGVIGIKTGTTEAAGHCLLFAARSAAPGGQTVTLVGVVMGEADAPSLFSDSQKLLASAQRALGLAPASPAGDVLAPPPLTPRVRAPRP